MSTAFSIVGDLLLKTGSFVTDVDRANKSLKTLQKQALDMKKVFQGSFLGGLASDAVTELISQLGRVPGAINDVVKSAGGFKDIEERTGAAAEQVAGFSIALATAETPIATLEEFMVKLNKGLSKTSDESDNAAKALNALGIPLKDFKALNPVQQVEALSKALAGFRSGPEQTAILEGLVKGGSQLLPFLKELEEAGGRQNILTRAQILLADEFSDRQARSAATLKAYAQVALLEAVPAVLALQSAFGELIKELINTGSSTAALTGKSPIKQFAEEGVVFIAQFVDSLRQTAAEITSFVATSKREFAELVLIFKRGQDLLERFGSLNFRNVQGGVDIALAERNKAVAEADAALLAQKQLDNKKFENLVRNQLLTINRGISQRSATTDPRSTLFEGNKPKIVVPDFGTSAANKDDPTKKLLENQLKALDRVIKQEQDLLQDRNRALDGLNALSLQSFQAYYDAQIAIIEAGGSAQIAAIDKQIAAIQAARAKPGTSQKDQADFEGKLQELQEKRAQVQVDSDRKIIEASEKKRQAEKQYQDQLKATSATVLELQGNLAAAAAIRFDLQNADLLKRADAEENDNLKALLATLRQAAVAQAEFAHASDLTGRALDALANREARIDIARTAGQTTEFQRLAQIRDARQEQIPVIEANVEALEKLARAPGANPALVQRAEDARLALERLKATADPLADTFRTLFEDAASTGIETFLDDVRKGKDALKAFADSALTQINRLVSQNISQSLFGQGGVFGGVGTFFSGLFGGQSAGAAGAAASATTTATANSAAATATTALATSATAASPAVTALAAAAELASAALASIGASKTTSTAAEFIDLGAFFAEGGAPPVGKVSVGGERGRELFFTSSLKAAGSRGTQTVSGPALIGQNGPTLFRPTVPGYVIPADETEKLLARFPDFGGAFAGGGSSPVGLRSLGGEMGVEAFLPVTAGRRLAQESRDGRRGDRRGGDTNISVQVQGSVDRRTRNQIANDIARDQRAAGRLA